MIKPMIFLDLDGVLADFEGWSAEVIGPDWKHEINEVPEWGRYKEYPNLYSVLPPMPGARQFYEECVQFAGDRNQVTLLTALPNKARHHFPDAAIDKIKWARRFIHPQIRVFFGPMAREKRYHCGTPLDVLIDDQQINIDQWNEDGGIGILHTSTESSLKQLRNI